MEEFIQRLEESNACLKIGNTINFMESFNGSNESRDNLRKKIEPWLSAILQSEHVSLLLGAGLTMAVGNLAKIPSSSMNKAEFGEFNKKINIYAEESAKKMGRGTANIEDQIRTSIELLHGYEIDENIKNIEKLGKCVDNVLSDFGNSILKTENDFREKLEREDTDADLALTILKSFLMTFSSRVATRNRLHIFTTNYDRFIEYACDYAGIRILDRFNGKINPYFEEAPQNLDYYYRTPDSKNEFRFAENVVKYSKIHGSIDWIYKKNRIYRASMMFGAEKIMEIDTDTYKDQLMIYPNPMKSIETSYYPYSELFRDFSGAVCRPNSALITYGYSFGDSHINKILIEMLHIPSAHIVIISYSVDERLINFLKKVNLAQVSLLCGSELGDLMNLVRYYLPKPAIDNITLSVSKLIRDREGDPTSTESNIEEMIGIKDLSCEEAGVDNE